MTTAVRIKRKAGEIAADSIVLAPKIARMGNADQAIAGQENYTFHYAGSFKNPSSPEAEQAIRRAKEAKRLKQDPKLRPVDLKSKRRDEYRSATKKKRLESSLRHRATIEELCAEEIIDSDVNALRESSSSLFRLYDVRAEEEAETDQATKENVDPKKEEKPSKIICSSLTMVKKTVQEPPENYEEFVYDFYYSAAPFNLPREEEYSLFKMGPPDAFAPEPAYDSDSDLGLEARDDDSDSNAEDNWRNDYPDEDFEKLGTYYGDFFDEEGTDFMNSQLKGLTLNFDDDPEADPEADPETDG